MRKMTKTVAVLAAMSAMTVASASLAFAATDNTAYSAIGKEAVAAGAASGEWKGSNVDGWTFTPTDGTKLKGTWAQIDGAWYYFDKDGIMAQEELMYLEGETYYFDSEGRMMANGWVGFDYDSDVVYDYKLDIDENIADIINPVYKNPADAYETVWMYFNADGSAKDDEWYQAESGLWYRFDDIIMVCGDFDHVVGNAVYGFDENGAMLVGWANNKLNADIKAPGATDKGQWYYYEDNGKKFDVTANNNGYGWKKIDGQWYCFYDESRDLGLNQGNNSVGTMISNTYFNNDQAANTSKSNFYYVNSKGVMATGVVTVDDGARYIDSTYTWADGIKVSKFVDCDWEVAFKSDGTVQSNAWVDDRFYADATSGWVEIFDKDDFSLTDYSDLSISVTGYTKTKETAADIKGALVKNAFITNKDKETFYVDKYGDKQKNFAVQIGFVNAAKDADGNYVSAGVLYDDKDVAEAALTGDEIVCKAYVLLNAKGIAYDDVDAGRPVGLGSKKYVATGKTFTGGAEVFYYYNKN